MIGLICTTLRPSALMAAFLIVTAIGSTQANARLTRASLPVPAESAYMAVHLPTGCLARVVLSDRALIKAWIIDADCLPQGVAQQSMPGKRVDFTVIPDDGIQ